MQRSHEQLAITQIPPTRAEQHATALDGNKAAATTQSIRHLESFLSAAMNKLIKVQETGY